MDLHASSRNTHIYDKDDCDNFSEEGEDGGMDNDNGGGDNDENADDDYDNDNDDDEL